MEFTDRNGIPIADDDESDDNPGEDLTEANTAGVNCPDLENIDNPPGLLLEPEEIDDDAVAYDQGHDDIPVIPEVATDNSSDNEDHDIPDPEDTDTNGNDILGVDPEGIPGVDTPEEIPGVDPEEIPGVDKDDDADTDPTNEPPPLGPDIDSSDDEDSDDEEEEPENEDNSPEVLCHPESMTPSIQRVHGLRPRRPRVYSNIHVNIVHHTTTQYSLKKGLTNFRGKAEDAASKELLQLHMNDTFAPQVGEELSEEQRKGGLESLMFLKKKRDGMIKG
jgi:hypothetical protein